MCFSPTRPSARVPSSARGFTSPWARGGELTNEERVVQKTFPFDTGNTRNPREGGKNQNTPPPDLLPLDLRP